MTYNVFGGMLNLALSVSQQIASVCSIHFDCILGEPCLFLTWVSQLLFFLTVAISFAFSKSNTLWIWKITWNNTAQFARFLNHFAASVV